MSLAFAGHLKVKIESDSHCLVMVGIDGHFVEVAEVVGCWEEEEEEVEVEGDQKEVEAGFGEEEEEEEVGYLVVVGEFVGVGG